MNIHAPRIGITASVGYRRLAVSQLWRLRGSVIIALLLASLAALAVSLWQLHIITGQNATISALRSGEDAGGSSDPAEVQLARVNFLIARDRFDDAQAVLDATKSTADPHTSSRMLYNQANANIRRAFAAIEGGKHDAAIPLTKLAKDGFREALRLDPMAWNAKHNYDVAARLMRDFPGYEQEGEETPPESDVKLWTDLPGVPQGAP